MAEGADLPKILSIFLNDDGKLKRVTYVLRLSDPVTLGRVVLDLRNLLGVGPRNEERGDRWELCDLNRKVVKKKAELYFQPASTFQLRKVVREADGQKRRKVISGRNIGNRGDQGPKKSNQEAKKLPNGESHSKNAKYLNQGINMGHQPEEGRGEARISLPAVHQSGPSTPSDAHGIKLSISKIRKGWILGKSALRYQPAKNLRAKKTREIAVGTMADENVKEELDKSVKEVAIKSVKCSVTGAPKKNGTEVTGASTSVKNVGGSTSVKKVNQGRGSVKDVGGTKSVKEDHAPVKISPKTQEDKDDNQAFKSDKVQPIDPVEEIPKVPIPEAPQAILISGGQKPADTVRFFDKFGEPVLTPKSGYASAVFGSNLFAPVLDRKNSLPLNSWYVPLGIEKTAKVERKIEIGEEKSKGDVAVVDEKKIEVYAGAGKVEKGKKLVVGPEKTVEEKFIVRLPVKETIQAKKATVIRLRNGEPARKSK